MRIGRKNKVKTILKILDIVLFVGMLFHELLWISYFISDSQIAMGVFMGIVFAITLIFGFLQWRFTTKKSSAEIDKN